MYSGKLVFAQVMDHLPMHTFRRAVSRYGGNRYVKSFPCHSQFLCMAFAQLTYRESLRDIEVCLRAQRQKLYHLGIRSPVSRNTLANANKRRQLANLRRGGASVDPHRQTDVRQRGPGPGPR